MALILLLILSKAICNVIDHYYPAPQQLILHSLTEIRNGGAPYGKYRRKEVGNITRIPEKATGNHTINWQNPKPKPNYNKPKPQTFPI